MKPTHREWPNEFRMHSIIDQKHRHPRNKELTEKRKIYNFITVLVHVCVSTVKSLNENDQIAIRVRARAHGYCDILFAENSTLVT